MPARWILGITALLLVAGLVSCGGRRKAVPASKVGTASTAQSAVAPRRQPSQPLAATVPPENPWFAPADWAESRMPEDFRIGLLDDGAGDGYRRLKRMCDALVEGRVDSAVIDPARSDLLGALLADQIGRGASVHDYRIGVIQPTGEGTARARVRFFGDGGSAEGEADLVRLADGWFVSDMQIDLAALKPAPQRTSPFLPSPYRGTID